MATELDTLREGTPWWVWVNLAEGQVSPGLAIAIPQPSKQGLLDRAHGGNTLTVNGRIVVLGFAWDFVAGAASVGFDLTFRDFSVSPALTRTLYRVTSQAAAQVIGSVTDTFLPLPAGKFGSPGDLTTVGNGATLFVDGTGTLPTVGGLLIWGIHTEGDWKPGKQFTGSPLSF
jgi:hypothetical protein